MYEDTLRKSLKNRTIDEKEAENLKNIYDHHIENRKEIMNNTKLTVENVFGN